ncbi:hypothetical protein O181_060424 [Austropuccinia psidii MF-1]|uniref:Uncharacterized protein n=1 Tax=Austropuccinia psidii MF-1 TaxID=1389203 RepID=A0A9Q3EG90_9BASI|nr:hypothetical protein [Austropuccinia psidii MF-1]
MPFQNPPHARYTRSQARAQDVLTPPPRAPLYKTLAIPQLRAHLDRGPNLEGAELFRKEGRGKRRLSSLSGVVGAFPGIWRMTSKGCSEDGEMEEDGSGKRNILRVLKLFLLLWGNIKVLEGQLPPSLIRLYLINLNHLYRPLCRRLLKLWPIFKDLHALKLQDSLYEGTRMLLWDSTLESQKIHQFLLAYLP